MNTLERPSSRLSNNSKCILRIGLSPEVYIRPTIYKFLLLPKRKKHTQTNEQERNNQISKKREQNMIETKKYNKNETDKQKSGAIRSRKK